MTSASAQSRSLYTHLDVSPSADDATIRRAYRRRAKSTHPDAPGGSPAAFAETSRALAILTDPTRRAKYDATGDTTDTPAPNRLAELMEIVMPLLDQACVESVKRGVDPLTQPLDQLMRAKAAHALAETRKKRTAGEAELKQAKKFLGRFKRRQHKGEAATPNLIEQGITHRLGMIENSLRMVDAEIDRWERVVEFLAGYSFKADDPAVAANATFVQMFTVC